MVCGVCLFESPLVIDIFGAEGLHLDIPSIIRQHFWFELNENDPVIRQICNSCWQQIASFHVFYTSIKNAHERISEQYYLNNKVELNNKTFDHRVCVQKDFKADQDVSEDNQSEIIPVTCVETTLPDSSVDEDYKNEQPLELSEDENQYLEQNYYENIDEDELISYCRNCYGGNASPSNCNFCNTTNDRDLNSMQISIHSSQGNYDYNNADDNRNGTITMYRKEILTKNDRLLFEDELIAKYMKLQCELCSTKCNTLLGIYRHYHLVHNIKGYVRCCEKKLFNRTYVLDHINIHINPSIYTCTVCKKIFQSQYALKTHASVKHGIDLTLDFQHKTPEMLIGSKSLNLPLSYQKPIGDQSLYCESCNELFPTKAGIKIHHNVYHKQLQGHICHICGEVMRARALFLKHMSNHTRQLGSAKVKIPLCPVCEKKSPTIKALRYHMKYVHSPLRPHICPICGKGFKFSQKLKGHMGTHIVGKPISCKYCNKRFKIKKHLIAHASRMHRTEFENEQHSTNSIETGMYEENEIQYDDDGALSDSSSSSDDCLLIE